jgi:hypothetical protein
LKPSPQQGPARWWTFRLFLTLTLPLLWAGCRTAGLLPTADFSAPGWKIQQGEAVWKPSSSRPELGGDLLLATNANGDCFVQFSKIPFPLATAQVSGNQWRMEYGADKYSWRGHGAPPQRFSWLLLPRALLGANPGDNWRFARPDTHSWRLENPRTGESLEGEFSP